MTGIFFHHKRSSLLTTFLIAFCLLFAGMRVPDLAHPQRPKPSQRAVLESQIKASHQIVNKSIDFFAFPVKPSELRTTNPRRTECVIAFNSTEFPPLFPNSSRAPPLFRS